MSVMPWEMSWFPSIEVFIAFFAFLEFLLVVVLYFLGVIMAKAQEGRPRQRRHRGNKGNTTDFILLESLKPLRTQCPVQPDMDAMYEIANEFNRTIENLTRHLEMLRWEMPDGSDNSWTSIMASEVGSSSRVSVSPWREDHHTSIMTTEATLSAEVSLSASSDNSPVSITASDIGSSSRVSLPTLGDGADMAHASSVQPGLDHPTADPESQPGPATHPPCGEEVASCLEDGSVQQHQQDLNLQLGAATPAPEVPEVHSREMEMPLHPNKGQDTLEGLIPESKVEQELGLKASVDETAQNVPASAPPSPPQQPEERDVRVVPIVPDLPFLDEAVKRELEHHITKEKIKLHFGLHTRILECEQSFEKLF